MHYLMRVALAAALLVTLTLSAHADEQKLNTPEAAAKAFCDALVKGDTKALLACMIWSESEESEMKRRIERLFENGSLVAKYELGESMTVEDRTRVKVALTIGAAPSTEVQSWVLVCVKEKQEWRVWFRKSLEETEEARVDIKQEADNILSAIKDRCRVVFQRVGRAATGIPDTGLKSEAVEMKYWRLREVFRVSADGKNIIVEAISKKSDDILLIKFNAENGLESKLGLDRSVSEEASKKDAQNALFAVRDYMRAQYQKLGAMPESVTGDAKTLTTFDLVSDQWIVHNEFANKGNTVTLTADSINQAKLAVLEFDITRGGGDVTYASSYTSKDETYWACNAVCMGEIVKALNIHKLDTGDYPDSLDAIVDRFTEKKNLEDKFTGKRFLYEKSEKGFVVKSLGRDCKVGGRWKVDKDIIFTEFGLSD